MKRTQIQLTEEQSRRVRAVARRKGISMAEVIRRCVDRSLDAEPADPRERWARAEELAGAFPDPEGAEDLSADHDRYLEGSIGEGS